MHSKLWQVAGGQGEACGRGPSSPEAGGQGVSESLEILTFDCLLDIGRCPITEGDCLQPQALHGKLPLVHSDMKLASASTENHS